MLPLKPPASKKKLKDVKLINFPICDPNGEVLDENNWPTFHGTFNGKVIIVKQTSDISRISNMVSKIIVPTFFLGLQINIFFILGFFWTIWIVEQGHIC